MKSKTIPSLQPRLRIRLKADIALGPGKADLLAAINETGSISQAAQQLKMSYMRAWSLIRTMNKCFVEPLVHSERGGKTGGGASLTPVGKQVLELYRRMEKDSLRIMEKDWDALKLKLRK